MSNKKKRKKFFKRNKIGIIIALILISYLSIVLIRQEIKLHQLKEEEQETLLKIQELEERKAELEEKINQSDDLDFIEKTAREKLKMVRPNEIIYIIQDNNKEKEE